MQVGFGKASLWGTFRTDFSLADEVDVCAMVCGSGDCTAVVVVADFLSFWPRTALRLGGAIASHLGIAAGNVGVFTTQSHGVRSGDNDELYDMPRLVAAFVAAVDAAVGNMQAVEIARVNTAASPAINICRRFEVKDVGAFTFWFGYRNLEDGETDANHLVRLALNDLKMGKATGTRSYHVGDAGDEFLAPASPVAIEEPLLARPADDGAIDGLFFRSAVDHQPVGSILRIGMHPVCSNRQGAKYHSGDYPAYARRRLEQAFGGGSLFLTGPCGDSCPRVGKKSIELAERVGEAVAECARAALPGARWMDGVVACASPIVLLPVRGDFPESRESAGKEAAELAVTIKQLAGASGSLGEIKILSDRYEMLTYAADGSFALWTGIDPFTCRGGIRHQLFLLRLGESVIAGLPGEPLTHFSVRLRNETIGEKLLVAEEANGYLSYIPTARAFAGGSYERNASMFGPEIEDVLVGAAARGIREIMK